MTIMRVFSKAMEENPEAGSALIDMVVYDFMCDLVEVNKADIQRVYGMWALDRVQVAKRALARGYVESVSKGAYPSDDTQQAAEWLAGIEAFVVAATRGEVSKAMNEWWDINGKQTQRQVARDAQGRFTRGVNQNKSRTIAPADTGRMSPALKPFSNGVDWQGGLKPEVAASHQGKYEEAVQHANELKNALGPNAKNADVSLLVQDAAGDIRNVRMPMKDVKGVKDGGLSDVDLAPSDSIIGVEAVPKMGASADEAARIAEFNLLGGAGGTALAQLANTDPKLRANLASSLKMPAASENKSGLTRMFDVLASGGAVLSSVPGGEKLGQMSALVGTMGPQAEEVLGPYVKRSAYRYRGTETTPEPGFRDPQAMLNGDQVKRIAQTFNGSSGEALRQHVIADAASGLLAEKLPKDPIVAQLSEASGQVLPSQGVIYDADGKLVTQSVGFTDDHYLPFDLNNLARLRGGQYVRTRVQGGLTGEDIYTTVMAGARQAQVVSSSGVFTIEFAPDFRGGRAMSDKARSMYTNYLKILDAVDGSGLYLEDISPREKQKAWDEAQNLLGPDADPKEVKALAERNIEQLRRSATSITDKDEENAAKRALTVMGVDMGESTTYLERAEKLTGLDRRKFADIYEDNLNEIQATKANRLRLNGEGYSVALQTLKEQFPYFIKDVKYRRLNELPTDQARELPRTTAYAADRGYAQPGSLRAKNVQTGYYKPGQLEPGAKPQSGPGAAAARAEAPVEGSKPVEAAKPEVAASTAKAPDQGMQKVISSDVNVAPRMSSLAADLVSGLAGIPLVSRSLTNMDGLDPESVANNHVQAVTWVMSQMDGKAVQDALTGPQAEKFAEALSDKSAINNAMANLAEESYFDEGGTLGPAKTRDEAVEWVYQTGQQLGDLAAMSQGFASASGEQALIDHRGLMPVLTKDIAAINGADGFKAFVENEANRTVVQEARGLSVGKNGESLSIASMAEKTAKRLDAMKQVAEGQKAMKARLISGSSGAEAVKALDASAWREATGAEFPTAEQLADFDVKQASIDLQKAWSLAVTGRILDIQNGGDVFPKAGSRLLEPVGKSLRRPLMSLAGTPIS